MTCTTILLVLFSLYTIFRLINREIKWFSLYAYWNSVALSDLPSKCVFILVIMHCRLNDLWESTVTKKAHDITVGHVTRRDRPNGCKHVNIFLSVLFVYLSVLETLSQSPCLPLLPLSFDMALHLPFPLRLPLATKYQATCNILFVCGTRSHSPIFLPSG